MTVIGLETQDRLTLPDGNQYHVRIDKLGCAGDTYYICDYKTNSRMKDQSEADSDRQLAMYSIWVKDKFKDASKVVLLWHMLAFDKEVTSLRSDSELKCLQSEVVSRIKEIESCSDFPTSVSALCDYCVFKGICPSFKHSVELEEKSSEEFKGDDGVKLVDEYASLMDSERSLLKRKSELQTSLVSFAASKGVDVVYGSSSKASVKEYSKVVYPVDKEGFVELLKSKGVYDSVSMVSYPKLGSLVRKKELDKSILEQLSTEKDYRISLSKRKDVEEE